MFNWLEEFYRIRRENRSCPTCEVLRLENARLLQENSKLIDRILEKPERVEVVEQKEFKPILPRNVSWNVRKQMLEQEDRRKAQLLKQQEKVEPITTEELEKELDVKERENAI
jgi:hypothetical protein